MNKPVYTIVLVLLIISAFFIGWYIKKNYTKHKSNSVATIITSTSSASPSPSPTMLTKYQVPIIMYHYIRDDTDQNDPTGIKLSVSPTNFDNQIKWLKDNNYQSVNPSYLLNPYHLSLNPVVLTFDDGYRDAYTDAYPILKKYHFTATFYIITDVVGDPAYMTWDMIKEMKNNGMNFGSHTVTHPDLSKATNQQIDYQLTTSTNTLKSELGIDIIDFCYPSGKYNDYIITKLEELGYKTTTTTHSGIADQTSNLFELPRLRIENNTNLQKLLAQQ